MKILNRLLFLHCLYFAYINSINSRFLSSKHSKENDLQKVTFKNNYQSLPPLYDFVQLELEQGVRYNIVSFNQDIISILEMSVGYFIIDFKNNEKPVDLSTFFSAQTSTKEIEVYKNDGVYFNRSSNTSNSNDSTEFIPTTYNRFIHSERKNSSDELSFIVLNISYKVLKTPNTYYINSQTNYFQIYDVFRTNIYSDYEKANETFQLLTDSKVSSPQQFLIEFLNDKLNRQDLHFKQIKTNSFIIDDQLITKNKRKVEIVGLKIKANNVTNNKRKQNNCFNNEYKNIEDYNKVTCIEIELEFSMVLIFNSNKKQLDFRMNYCVLINGSESYVKANGTGYVTIHKKGKEIGIYEITRIGEDNID